MRHFIHMLAFALTAEPPASFEVVNKCPPAITVVNKCPARSVPATTFRSPVNHGFVSGHICPNPDCRKKQTTIDGRIARDGTHWHECEYCHDRWYHR